MGTDPMTPAQRDAHVIQVEQVSQTWQISQVRWSPASTIGAEP